MTRPRKCIVRGCVNHNNEGPFVGGLCVPCHNLLTTGRMSPSNAWFVQEIEYLTQLVGALEDEREKADADH